jgi:hypothetical protein
LEDLAFATVGMTVSAMPKSSAPQPHAAAEKIEDALMAGLVGAGARPGSVLQEAVHADAPSAEKPERT